MTNETQQYDATERKPIPFGSRLKSAREALGLEHKDVAVQLRLNEKIIMMMEKDKYPPDLPTTFIRGYIRSYGKFLQIPEYEIKKGLEPIEPKPTQVETVPVIKELPPITSGNYFVQFFTYLIIFTMLGLVGMWWYSRTSSSPATPSQSQLSNLPDSITSAITEPKAANPAAEGETAATTTMNDGTPQAGENKVPSATPPVVNSNDTNHTDAAPSAPSKSSANSSGKSTQKSAKNADDDDNDDAANVDDDDDHTASDNTETNSDTAD